MATNGKTARRASRPGIKDVAARANVSWKTVSNVVNGTAAVRPETRERVEEAIAELGYRPNLSGRSLRQGRTNIIALAVNDLRLPYFSELAHAVIEAAGKQGYTVLLDETGGDLAAEKHAASGFGAHLLDGLILSPHSLTPDDLRQAGEHLPTVLLGEHALVGDRALPDDVGHIGLDRVVIDNLASATDATRHLVDQGRERIAFLGAAEESTSGAGALRRDGYLRGLPDGAQPLVLPTSIYSRREGYERTQDLLREASAPPDALMCANDQLAIGALRALREVNLRVPQDVAVLGWDGSEEGEFANPSLSSVAPNLADLAQLAVSLLMSRIKGEAKAPKVHVLPHELRIRQSTMLSKNTTPTKNTTLTESTGATAEATE